MNKKELRQKYLNLRSKLSLCQSDKSSLSQKLIYIADKINCVELYLYKAFRAEIDVESLLENYDGGKKRFYPNISHGDEIKFVRFENQIWHRNKFGILELPLELDTLGVPGPRTLIVTPCAAFDKRGYRLGYGGGYYDRYMEKYPDAVYCAIAYDEQELDSLPVEVFDKRVNFIVTPSQIVEC